MKEECRDRFGLDDEECEKCPYHFSCPKESSAWADVAFGN